MCVHSGGFVRNLETHGGSSGNERGGKRCKRHRAHGGRSPQTDKVLVAENQGELTSR